MNHALRSGLSAVSGVALSALLLASPLRAAEGQDRLARDILGELVAVNTAASGGPGQTLKAAGLLAARLVAAGFPPRDVQVLGLAPGDGNLLAWYRSGRPARPPILLMAHLDVVEALPAEWDTDPFRLVERDGYLYGRGTRDIKNGAASLVASFIRLRQEGFRPDRDLILFFTADEETTMANTRWLATEKRALINAAFALNTDGGFVDEEDGRPVAFVLQTAEKIYASYRLEATSAGGHSSLPTDDNAIYELADALQRLRRHRFPRELNETTRAYFGRWAAIAPQPLRPGALALGAGRTDDPAVDELEKSPYLAGLMRTTCVPTQVQGGTDENVLPERAHAVVNCRILPQTDPGAIESRLREIVQADGIVVTPVQPAVAAPPSPLEPGLISAIESVAGEIWPGIPLLPQMSPGATDGMYLRNAGIPTYGVGAVAEGPDEDRSHAPNERIRIRAFNDSTEFLYRLIRRLASP